MKAQRPRDQIWIEGDRGRFDRFSSIEISTDIFGEAQCTLSVSDDRAWRTLRDLLAPGRAYRVLCNGLVQFTGRVDCDELPVTVDGGTEIQVVMRTRLADARVGSADTKVRTENTSLKRFLVGLFARHGFVESDFLFNVDADRDLVTGRRTGRAAPTDLDPLTADKAKVQPNETTEQAAKRHLERHHLMLWDAATGLIAVGIPSDTQPPLYRFVQRPGSFNFREARPVRDWGDLPSSITVRGGAVGGSTSTAAPSFKIVDGDLRDAALTLGQFRRPVIMQVQGIKDQARAEAQARRELAVRSRRKAAWEIRCDDWTFWDGSRATPYAIATTADLDIEMHDGTDLRGIFLVTAVRKSYTLDEGAQASLTLIKQGLINPTGAT